MAKKSNTGTITTQSNKSAFNNVALPDAGFVSSDQYDYILSYFDRITDNRESAKTLAGSVVYTAKAQGLNPLSVLEEFRKIPAGEMSLRIALFLNDSRFGSSYLGLKSNVGIGAYVTRAILQ